MSAILSIQSRRARLAAAADAAYATGDAILGQRIDAAKRRANARLARLFKLADARDVEAWAAKNPATPADWLELDAIRASILASGGRAE